MNPVIYFDELDKVSGTSKGEEIYGILTHLTDPIQNKHFSDRYFSGIDFDLSRVLFIFSFNDAEKINPILRDRLRIVHTQPYNKKEKRIIGEKYMLPKIIQQFGLKSNDIVLNDDCWNVILENRTEDGVRALKRDLETIISRLNVLRLFNGKKIPETIAVKNIEWKPGVQLTVENIRNILSDSIPSNKIPMGM